MKYYVYLLFSLKDRLLYIGPTSNLKNRYKSHSKGSVRSTKDRRPLILIHYEYFIDKKEALAREKFLKSGITKNYKIEYKFPTRRHYTTTTQWERQLRVGD